MTLREPCTGNSSTTDLPSHTRPAIEIDDITPTAQYYRFGDRCLEHKRSGFEITESYRNRTSRRVADLLVVPASD